MTRKLLIPALALTVLGTTPALAQEQVRKVGDGFIVRTADLNLAQDSGRNEMMRRLRQASGRICAKVTPRLSRIQCVQATVNEALHNASPLIQQAALRSGSPRRLAAR